MAIDTGLFLKGIIAKEMSPKFSFYENHINAGIEKQLLEKMVKELNHEISMK